MSRARLLPVRASTASMVALTAVVAFFVLVPLALNFVSSFQLSSPGMPAVYGLDGWRTALTNRTVLSAFGNTFALTLVRQSIALALGILVAWLLARTDLPWRGGLEFAFWLTYFLPSLPVALGWILLLDPKRGILNQLIQSLVITSEPVFNIYSFWGIVWVHMGHGIAIKVMLLSPAFRNMDAALEEASHVAGASALGTFRRIIIPIMAPPILVTMILSIIYGLEAFEIELLLGVPFGFYVFSTKIYDFVHNQPAQYAPATALSTVFLVSLLLLVALQRWYISRASYQTITGKGFTTRVMRLGRWRYPAMVFVGLLVVLYMVVPVLLLLMATFMTAFGYFDIPRPWTLGNWQRVLADPLLLRSLSNTLLVGAGAAIGGVLLYSLVAYTVVKTRFAGRGLLDFISWLPVAVPGILLGLAFLWMVFLTRFLLPIYGTVFLLMLAMVVKSMPVGVQLTRSVLLQIGNELEEASRTSGGSWIQTYRRIVVPLLLPTFITVGIVSFIAVVRDISTVVLLGSSQSRTLALLMLDYATEAGQYGQAAVVAVVNVAIMILAALLARRLAGAVRLMGG